MRHDWSWKAATKCFAVGLLVFGLTVGLAPVVGAIPIADLDGTWQNAVGGANVTINNALDPREARWGITSGDQSGYNWSPTPAGFDAPTDGTLFRLGSFNHLNFVIESGTAITSIDLNFHMEIDGTSIDGVFTFNHDETPNPAPDEITITGTDLNTQFLFEGILYNFSILGFISDIPDGGLPVTTFVTAEDDDNPAGLYGAITVVPEPATMLLLGSGLIGLAAFARRRFRK